MKKFPDLTGDGKVTQADILKGRGVKAARAGGAMHKMPDGTMMPGKTHRAMGGGTMKYRMGGSVDGCAIRGKTKRRMC